MKSHNHLGTFEAIISNFSEKEKTISKKLRALIESLDPEVEEVPRNGELTAAYGIGPKKMSEAYAYIGPKNGYVNLGFYHGTALDDPDNLLEGTGNKLRHIKIRSLAQADSPEVKALIIEARNERLKALKK